MRTLVTGAKGRLGSRLVELLHPSHAVTGIDIDSVDFTDFSAIRQVIQETRPELVLHCGAMTAVDDCALRPDEAIRVNGFGTKNVALACLEVDAAMLYISTNEVFDGQNVNDLLEYDPIKPANPYGYSKMVGEQVVRDHLRKFYIVRTSWLFAHGGTNFIHAIIKRARENQPLRVVVNEVACPTYNEDLAEAVVKLIQTHQYGVYHLVNEGRASRWTFARKILDLMGCEQVDIEKISAAEYPRPSTPPEYAVLRNTAASALGITLRPWQNALEAYLQREGLLGQS